MRALSIGSVAIFATGLATGLGFQLATDHKPVYTPKPGDTVVLYTHQFDKANWATARKDFLNHLYKEVKADHTHVRDSFILESPERAEIVGVTLWRSEKDLNEWEHLRERNKNMKELDKTGGHPYTAKRYKILGEVIE